MSNLHSAYMRVFQIEKRGGAAGTDHFSKMATNRPKGIIASTQADMHPCAYNNPIFVDVDGGGFTANGDTLGYPLPTKNLTIGQVQGHLGDAESQSR